MTLSTAIIAVGFAFVKDIAPQYTGKRLFLTGSALMHLLSCGFGIWVFMAITGQVAKAAVDIYSLSITLPACLQVATFFLGLFSMFLVIVNIGRAHRATEQVPPPK